MAKMTKNLKLILSSPHNPEGFPKFRQELEDFRDQVNQKTHREVCLVDDGNPKILEKLGADDFDFTIRKKSFSILKVRFHNGRTCIIIRLGEDYKWVIGQPILRHEGINFIMRYLAKIGVLSDFSVTGFTYNFS